MTYLKNWFLNLRIKRKLLVFSLSISITVLIIAGLSLMYMSSRVVIRQSEAQMQGTMEELSENFDNYFSLINNSFGYITSNNVVQDELTSENPDSSTGDDYYSYNSKTRQLRRLLLQVYSSVYMHDIQLIGYNGASHILSNGEKIDSLDEKIIEAAKRGKGRTAYCNKAEESGLLYSARQINDSLTMKPIGIVSASIKTGYLANMTNSLRLSFSAETMLLDSDGNIIFSTVENSGEDKGGPGSTEDMDKLIQKVMSSSSNFNYRINGIDYKIFNLQSTDTGFILVSLLPSDYVMQTATEMLKMMIILLLFSGILCVILASIMSKAIAEPIERSSRAMEQFAEGDFDVRLPEGRSDEIGTMNRAFNNTIIKIKTLLNKVVEMETINKDIEFQALQAQINPHFFYNVLDTINWMARKKGEDNICRMITSISNLMRASISNKKSVVSIEEEMKYIKDYLYIQETRYGDRFASIVEIDEQLYPYQIPKMSLQILVENAVVHGVENATWNCYISITSNYSPGSGYASFIVADNGIGMSKEKVDQLLSGEESAEDEKGSTHTHFGIRALKKRIDYFYGGDADLKIDSVPQEGTTITLTIPLRKELHHEI